MRSFLVLAVLLLIPATSPAVDDEALRTAAKSITEAELRDHMYFLADDALAGRMPGEQGYRIAALYAASQFRASELSTLIDDDDGQGTFLQPVPMRRLIYGSENHLFMRRGGEELKLESGEGYILFRPGANDSAPPPHAPVFIGYGVHEPDHGWDDYEGVDFKDRFAVIMPGAPTRSGKPVLPEELHNHYNNVFRGAVLKSGKAIEAGAGGVIYVPNLEIALGWNALKGMLERMRVGPAFESKESGSTNPPVPVLIAHPNLVNKMFAGRAFDPLSGKGEYGVFPLDDIEIEISIDAKQEEFGSNNVVAVVRGTDPKLADEYVTVGAHLDHVGITDGEVYNGADDNASGSVAVLEAAEAVALHPPRRSVIFILYSAEEIGLLGSEYFVEFSPVPLDKIVVNINLDMVGRSNSKPPGFEVIGSKKICDELKQLVIDVNNRRVGAELDFSTDESDPNNYFGRSDHFNFHKRGIPTVFLSTGEHPDYHTPADDVDKIDFAKLRLSALLTFELIMALADREEMICAPRRSSR